MPSALDREVASRDLDAFGHRHFADALRSLIESPDLEPPFSIGLLGGWGTGKSTIKALYQSELADDATGRREHVHVVTFNAWRNADNVKRALLRQVYLEIGGSEQTLNEKLFGETRRVELSKRNLGRAFVDTLLSWSMPLGVVLVLLILAFLVFWGLLSILCVEDETARTTAAAVLTVLAIPLLKQVKLTPASIHEPVTKVELPTTTAEQFQDLLLEQLRTFKNGHASIKGAKRCERLVVFVDDLDRLSAEEMVQGLDAIRTFMEIPEADLPDGLGIVFVISCDEERVAHALDRGRRHAELPGSVFNRTDARRYLDRIFQFRLEIPSFPRRDMRDYAHQKIQSLKLEGLAPHALRGIVETMIHVRVQSPRNALQIVNAFAQSWWIARRREQAAAGTDKPGGLYEGAVTEHPLTLAAVCALRVDFPDFYSDLQQQQDLIQRFSDIVFRAIPFEDLPERTREILAKYLQKNDEEEGSAAVGPRVHPDHRGLRQYLASLLSHRWPKSVQPFLLLSLDPVSRKYGDAKHALLEALVSGDVAGVLEVLGRSADDKPLRTEDVLLLRDMTEDLSGEPESRRQAASSVLASLVDRLPEGSAHLLVPPLTRQLQTSIELRSQLGVAKIRALLRLAEVPDQRVLAQCLIDDNLTEGKPLQFKLKSGEEPSLDEAIGIARETVSCVLAVQAQHGLSERADARLRQWLLSRHVQVGSGNHQVLPFSELHGWVKDYQSLLLGLLGSGYTDLFISELEAESLSGELSGEGLDFTSTVFQDLESSGEQSRPTLWKQLGRLARVREAEAVRLAWETMNQHSSGPSPTAFSEIVEALAERLTKEMQEQEGWDLDWDAGARAILAIVESRPTDLSAEAQAAFKGLVLAWTGVSDTGVFAARGIHTLSGSLKQEILDSWIAGLFSGLPMECIDELAACFETLPDAQQAAVCTQISASVVTPTAIAKGTSEAHARLLEAFPETAWSLDSLQQHLTDWLPVVASRHNNPDSYLTSVFKTAVSVLSHAEAGVAGNMLHTLFSNAKSQPAHYSWLHCCMATKWPQQATELAPYSPQTIFDEAKAFAASHPQQTKQGLLASMRYMLETELVTGDRRKDLVDAACASWGQKPEHAEMAMTSLPVPPSAQQVANLLDPIAWDVDKEVSRLVSAWSHISTLQDMAAQSETIRHILAKGVVGDNDAAVSLWLEQCTDRAGVLTSAFRDSENNDDARARLWAAALRQRDKLEQGFYLESLRFLLPLPDSEQTARSIDDSKEELAPLFAAASDRAELASTLICEVFPKAPTNTVKGIAAKWARELDGHAPVKKLDAGEMTMNDLEILEAHFGTSTTKKLRKAIVKLSDE